MENQKTGQICDGEYTKKHERAFSKMYKKLEKNKRLKSRVDKAIEEILADPFKVGNKTKDASLMGAFVYKLGDYRIFYFINSKERFVSFIGVFHRSEAYN